MKLIVAQTAGFCMGVKRAVDLALDVSHGADHTPLYSLGPLIHNGQTIEMLRQRGVNPLADGEMPPVASTVIIRAHGVPPTTEQEFKSQGHCIVDGTCPKVKTVHKVIEKYRELGYSIIITGDKGHAEVVGLLGYAKDAGHLVQTEDDITHLPLVPRVCLVSQTTFDTFLFGKIEQAVRAHFSNAEIVVKKTICSATDKRQNETTELASRVDALIVVGGKQSANTKRLASIAQSLGKPTQLVETEEDVDFDAIADCQIVGITAGASTPSWMIKRVVEYIQFMAQQKKRSVPNLLWHGLDVLTNINVFAALGACGMYYLSCVVQGIVVTSSQFFAGGLVFFLYFFAIYLWNSISTLETTQHLGISRYRFYLKHQKLLFLLTGISLVGLLGISFALSRALFFLMSFSTLVGTVYHSTIVPSSLQRFFRYRNLKDIPTSRDLFIALAWSVLAVCVPIAIAGTVHFTFSMLFVFCEVFILAYLRSVIFDMRDIEGDRIMGRETLVTFIGEKRIRKAIVGMIGVSVFTLVCVAAIVALHDQDHWKTACANYLSQVPVFAYLYLFMRLSQGHRLPRASLFNILVDLQFGIAVVCAYLVAYI